MIGLNNNKQTKTRYKYIPWVEKYRPKKLNDIIYQNEIVNMLKVVVETGNLPHLLLYGPPGCGKTSVALSIAMELFGPRKIKARILELNASDERGINVVRNKIITFAKGAIGNRDPKYPCPPYKIIILDEADAMTMEAQSALRKTIEKYSHITRFCFICNYINQIIKPIKSRCVKLRFKPITKKYIATRLKYIAKKENLKIMKNVINRITDVVNGDMRRAIMLLQNLKYNQNINGVITTDDVNAIAAYLPEKVINDINYHCISNTSRNYKKIIHIAKHIILCGYPMDNVMKQIHDMIIPPNITNNMKLTDKLTDNMRCIICKRLSKIEDRLLHNGDEYLQLLSILTCIKNVTSRA